MLLLNLLPFIEHSARHGPYISFVVCTRDFKVWETFPSFRVRQGDPGSLKGKYQLPCLRASDGPVYSVPPRPQRTCFTFSPRWWAACQWYCTPRELHSFCGNIIPHRLHPFPLSFPFRPCSVQCTNQHKFRQLLISPSFDDPEAHHLASHRSPEPFGGCASAVALGSLSGCCIVLYFSPSFPWHPFCCSFPTLKINPRIWIAWNELNRSLLLQENFILNASNNPLIYTAFLHNNLSFIALLLGLANGVATFSFPQYCVNMKRSQKRFLLFCFCVYVVCRLQAGPQHRASGRRALLPMTAAEGVLMFCICSMWLSQHFTERGFCEKQHSFPLLDQNVNIDSIKV